MLLQSFVSMIPTMGFPSVSAGKEFTCKPGDPSSIPGLETCPGQGISYSLQYSCLENPHRHRSLVGYSPRVAESDMTE